MLTLSISAQADLQRAAILYLPLTAAAIARLLSGKRPRQFAACLLSTLWTIPTLLILQKISLYAANWWTFPGANFLTIYSMPLELYFGWIVLWGILPQIAFPRLGILPSTAIMVALDVVLMPLCTATIQLNSNWLIGELLAVLLILLPARAIAHWTYINTHLAARAALQLILAALLFLFFIPELAFIYSRTKWTPLLASPSWEKQLMIQFIFLLALPGIGAVVEFAQRGAGTPIPYDPPQRLVTTGIYRYLANPMQLSCFATMFCLATWLGSYWMIAAAIITIAYSAGLAEWDEAEDLNRRFGEPWKHYRTAVHNWHPRLRPYHAGSPATLYIASTCIPCTQLRAWIERRHPIGLQIIDAETLPADSIHRMRYDPTDSTPTVDGIRALGRALEHLNLGWALAGATLRLPGIWQLTQLLMDTAGLGPRTLTHQPSCEIK